MTEIHCMKLYYASKFSPGGGLDHPAQLGMVLFYLFYYRLLDTYTALRLKGMCLQGKIISIYQTVHRIRRLFKLEEKVRGRDEKGRNSLCLVTIPYFTFQLGPLRHWIRALNFFF